MKVKKDNLVFYWWVKKCKWVEKYIPYSSRSRPASSKVKWNEILGSNGIKQGPSVHPTVFKALPFQTSLKNLAVFCNEDGEWIVLQRPLPERIPIKIQQTIPLFKKGFSFSLPPCHVALPFLYCRDKKAKLKTSNVKKMEPSGSRT